MSDLVFYTNPMSRGRIVRWALEEVGQPYRTELLDFRGGHKSPDYLAINPMGKVPAIVHDGTVVTECAAICAYLADAFPQAGLAPASGDRARGDYYRWLFFAAGPLEAAVVNKVLKVEVPNDPQMRGMVGYGSLEAVLDTIEGAVSKAEYLAGGRFSAADLYVGAHLGWGMQFGTIPKRPAFEAYAGRLYGRPAAVRAREIDDTLIAEKNVGAA
ncbi:glutathione S-transferase family protein [Methylobacterium sp. C25]|uniref:glutathione S-transferase family protein n=1 Tax=Methylobacterium sp. C25 TaxID=2721622 RepID=UPI001F4194AC|nr:glutathione S-transferase family protein [Methylobacterium sp. C25]MCE4225910.1 glutathione S-transferase family protein [Methylobacterium sp. C25]